MLGWVVLVIFSYVMFQIQFGLLFCLPLYFYRERKVLDIKEFLWLIFFPAFGYGNWLYRRRFEKSLIENITRKGFLYRKYMFINFLYLVVSFICFYAWLRNYAQTGIENFVMIVYSFGVNFNLVLILVLIPVFTSKRTMVTQQKNNSIERNEVVQKVFVKKPSRFLRIIIKLFIPLIVAFQCAKWAYIEPDGNPGNMMDLSVFIAPVVFIFVYVVTLVLTWLCLYLTNHIRRVKYYNSINK